MKRRVPIVLSCLLTLCGSAMAEESNAETKPKPAAAAEAPALPAVASEEDQKRSRELFQAGLNTEKEKDLAGAIQKWEEALKADGQNAACLNHYAWFLGVTAPAERRDLKKALELALRAAQVSERRNRDILDTVAEVYFQLKQYAQAIETQKQALAEGLEGNSKRSYLEEQLAKFEKALEASKSK